MKATLALNASLLREESDTREDVVLEIGPADRPGNIVIAVGCHELFLSVEEARAIAAAMVAVAWEQS